MEEKIYKFSNFRVHSSVIHKDYGKGKIITLAADEYGNWLEVNFRGNTTKKFYEGYGYGVGSRIHELSIVEDNEKEIYQEMLTEPIVAENFHTVLLFNGFKYKNDNNYFKKDITITSSYTGKNYTYKEKNSSKHLISTDNFEVFLAFLHTRLDLKEYTVFNLTGYLLKNGFEKTYNIVDSKFEEETKYLSFVEVPDFIIECHEDRFYLTSSKDELPSNYFYANKENADRILEIAKSLKFLKRKKLE